MVEKASKSKIKLRRKLKKIRMLITDVDGVLTDGGIVLGNGGQEFKVFSVQDGMGITLLRQAGLKVGIITSRRSDAVEVRAQELHVDVLFQGASNKLVAYDGICDSYDFRNVEVCYIGDDLSDIPVMNRVGVAVAVANATEEVKQTADIVTLAGGGEGAVREVVEIILKSQGKWKAVLETICYKKNENFTCNTI